MFLYFISTMFQPQSLAPQGTHDRGAAGVDLGASYQRLEVLLHRGIGPHAYLAPERLQELSLDGREVAPAPRSFSVLPPRL